jgi:hypothetical protein
MAPQDMPWDELVHELADMLDADPEYQEAEAEFAPHMGNDPDKSDKGTGANDDSVEEFGLSQRDLDAIDHHEKLCINEAAKSVDPDTMRSKVQEVLEHVASASASCGADVPSNLEEDVEDELLLQAHQGDAELAPHTSPPREIGLDNEGLLSALRAWSQAAATSAAALKWRHDATHLQAADGGISLVVLDNAEVSSANVIPNTDGCISFPMWNLTSQSAFTSCLLRLLCMPCWDICSRSIGAAGTLGGACSSSRTLCQSRARVRSMACVSSKSARDSRIKCIYHTA